MHNPLTAHETLELMWDNYSALSAQVDIEAMDLQVFEKHIEQKALARPFRIAAWLTRQGHFIAVWSLWEFYATNLCESLGGKLKKQASESNVICIRRTLEHYGLAFDDFIWFDSANYLRNLITHNGARVHTSNPAPALAKLRVAFPNIDIWPDGYVALEHEHVAELHCNVETFIESTSTHFK